MLTPTGEIMELMLEVPQGQVISYDLAKLCSALGIADPTRIAVETDGLRRAIVTIYPSNPLADVRAVTVDDLIMDRRGYIVTGRYHNGRPVKLRLFDPSTGSAQRSLVFGTTGAGKSRVLQMMLIAEKRNRIVSWVCDLKHGQSVPEARGNVDWFGTTPEEAILMLMAAVAVAQARMVRYSAMGRTAFMLGDPDPLIHVSIEEANRLLEKGSPYRDQATYLIRELGRTGRSVGVGIRLNAQASHLEELGGSDTLRAMLKEGEVILLRWSSSMMRQLVSDGLLPAGAQLIPIPKTLKPVELTSQFDAYDDQDDDGAGTQGTAYILSGSHPTSMMRHWRVGSILPLPGLDPEILALYGDDDPAHLELASGEAAGAAYQNRHDPDAMQALFAAMQEEQAKNKGQGNRAAYAAAADDDDVPAGPRPALLEDRVLAVLAKAEKPMTAEDVLAVVKADGGRQVSLGGVRNTLTALAKTGGDTEPEVVRVGPGLYAHARQLTTV
jgi:hypothetical protein